MNSAEARALIVATHLLRQQMADLPRAIIDNLEAGRTGRAPGRPAPQPGGAANAGLFTRGVERAGSAALGLAMSFARLLGPLVALNTFLGQTSSGFGVFNKAMTLLAATLAPVLLPAFFLLSVALASISDVIVGRLYPSLEEFYRLVLSVGIPTLVRFIELLARAADVLARYRAPLTAAAGAGAGTLAGGDDNLFDALAGGFFFGKKNVADETGLRAAAPGEPGAPGAPGLPGRPAAPGEQRRPPEVKRAISDTLAELRLAMAPQASSGSIASVYSRAQMAALNQSPFERRMLELMEKVTTAITRAAADPGARTAAPGTVTEHTPAAR